MCVALEETKKKKKFLLRVSNYLRTCPASFPRAQGASLLISTLSSTQGVCGSASSVAPDSIHVETGNKWWQLPISISHKMHILFLSHIYFTRVLYVIREFRIVSLQIVSLSVYSKYKPIDEKLIYTQIYRNRNLLHKSCYRAQTNTL